MEKPTVGNFKDLEGKQFGRWEVIGYAGRAGGRSGGALWECRCECGAARVVRAVSLLNGKSRSCGCLHREVTRKVGQASTTHGKSSSKEYRAWNQMIQRCHNPNNPTYQRYGKLGITVCEDWKASFAAFYRDMGCCPSKEHTLDRIDPEKGYCPENCRWLLGKHQAGNRKYVKRYDVAGEMLSCPEIAERFGLKARTVKWRIRKGWSMERVISQDPAIYHGRTKQ